MLQEKLEEKDEEIQRMKLEQQKNMTADGRSDALKMNGGDEEPVDDEKSVEAAN